MDINLNLYRIFYFVAQSKSYSEASEKLHLSVPSISISINKLENLLDTKLFYRENNGVRLTSAGNELFKLVEQGLSSIELGEKLVTQKNDLENGEISIGCYSHIANFFLMDKIEKAILDYPNLKINMICCTNSKEMLDLLQNHKLDFVMDTTSIVSNYENITIKELQDVENIFVSKEKIEINDLKELNKFNFILNFDYTLTHKELLEILRKNNTNIIPKIRCDITEIRIEAAKRNMGIAYVMKKMVEKELENGELFEVKFPIKFPTTKIKIIYFKEQLTKASKKFIKKYLSK